MQKTWKKMETSVNCSWNECSIVELFLMWRDRLIANGVFGCHKQMSYGKGGLWTQLLECLRWRSRPLWRSRNWMPPNCSDWQNMSSTLSINPVFNIAFRLPLLHTWNWYLFAPGPKTEQYDMSWGKILEVGDMVHWIFNQINSGRSFYVIT